MERVLLVKHRLDNVFVCGPGDKSFRTSQINRRSDDNLGELHAARPADQQREKLEDGARHGEGHSSPSKRAKVIPNRRSRVRIDACEQRELAVDAAKVERDDGIGVVLVVLGKAKHQREQHGGKREHAPNLSNLCHFEFRTTV